MKVEEIDAVRGVYTGLVVARALEEIGEPWALGEEGESESKRLLAERVRADAFYEYQQQRGPGASDAEFEYIWLLVRDDLVREARALEAMRK